MRDRSGLLTGHGVDEYGFQHLSFQEYLAAEEIRNTRQFGLFPDSLRATYRLAPLPPTASTASVQVP